MFSFLIVMYAFVATGDAIKCYTCASSNLQNNWYLSGFPDKAILTPATLFMATAQCQTYSTTNVATWGQTECSSSCLVYFFQGLDSTGTLQTYVVRGCLDQLVGTTVTALTTAPRCEVGPLTVYDSTGKPKSGAGAKAWSYICNTDQCYNKDSFDQTAANCQIALATTTAPTSCVVCGIGSSNCVTPQTTCTGANWCRKTVTTLNGVDQYSHDCAPTNPTGYAGCQTISTTGVMQGRTTVSYKATTCYCNTNNCNMAGRMRFSLFVSTLALFVSALCFSK